VDVTASLEAEVEPARLFEVLSDLGTYPSWLDIVSRAEPAGADPGDPGPAWSVDLRGQLGPLRRSKRIRMVRSLRDEPSIVTFERRELDGREHSDWILEAQLSDTVASTRLDMRLHYGGSLWVPLLDRLLADEIERSRGRLVELIEATS
jgi:hypothetical protein